MTSLYSIPITFNDGSEGDFGRFQGKAVMVVNVASECGFTRQYAGLEELYGKYRGQGLEILGVPCNQFGGQEPGADAEIAEFCERNFGVTFPLTSKANVLGKEQHPLFAELTRDDDGQPVKVKWNFEKFVINRAGELVGRFPSAVEPDSEDLLTAVEKALA
ncbi:MULTISPECIES: glutathione peroxidase [Paenarthrobacter]|jgi:glutathione peroxidase|uniref:Glutathione peroxidase n=1 Tax=Paenarthrobacter nicotinovorans TaxID=29320 RepID=A0ABT9TKD5_PAENI|nr:MULTISPECIES: glutathione peroxidase [Paenarthrobacter]KQQ98577.1 glutathione peroxidase [Arthrobacter sp. Leaf145]SKB68907.1 glutathione peroxidase [Arthrobacter sp. 31Cvi3.1E]BCW39084.1 glutathione peroxidase [Arthrobacter sp. StoSoilB3]MBP2393980.1 glutathione peroxidase [Paenarthrobacter nicotinovorans]MDI2023723.1 Glutathione peroxidase BsaA [Paenarthrobacter nicotinovorans]